jgi:hypothetical protein
MARRRSFSASGIGRVARKACRPPGSSGRPRVKSLSIGSPYGAQRNTGIPMPVGFPGLFHPGYADRARAGEGGNGWTVARRLPAREARYSGCRAPGLRGRVPGLARRAESLAREVPGLVRKALSFAYEAKSLAAGALSLGRGPGEAGRRRLLLGGGGQGLDLGLAGEMAAEPENRHGASGGTVGANR